MSKIEQHDGYTVEYIGQEGEPLVVIEDFHTQPEHLVADAARRPFKTPPPGYPGIRAPAPSQYLMERGKVLAEILGKVFGYTREAKLIECSYSLVTTPAEKLYPAQRIPHHDSSDPNLVALLHYLCGPEKGGTSHYRHVTTGFETVRAPRANTYLKTLEAEEERDGPPPQSYFQGSNSQFESIAQTHAKFNRVVMYRGVLLHSGDIPAEFNPTPDVKEGRLTVNSFFLQG